MKRWSETPTSIATEAHSRGLPASQRTRHRLTIFFVAVCTLTIYAPALRNEFLLLGFDDAIILDSAEIRSLGWENIRKIFTEYRAANYIPLTMLSFAINHHFVGLEPFSYHLVNILLHAANAVLVWIFLRPILPSTWATTFATMIFALHPLQVEAVSLAIQRKTLLAGLFFLMTMILYQRWWETRHGYFWLLALCAFLGSVAAKPVTVTLPVLLLFYEHAFVRRRPRLLDKIPLFAVSLLFSVLAIAASRAVGAVKAPHGGNWLAHASIVSRASMDHAAALFAPVELSPIYYYRVGTEYSVLNLFCFLVLFLVFVYTTWHHRRLSWTFFSLGWFTILMLPQSNIIPLAQLRPDRYLYLSIIGFGLWLGVGLERVPDLTVLRSRWRKPGRWLGAGFVGALAIVTLASIPAWRNDFTAWREVVKRHPWCGVAHYFLGVAHYDRGRMAPASMHFELAVARDPELADAYLHLARAYHQRGLHEAALRAVHALMERRPGDPQGSELLRMLRAGTNVPAATGRHPAWSRG